MNLLPRYPWQSLRTLASLSGLAAGISLSPLALASESPVLTGTRPAEIAEKSVSTLLTDIVYTGEQYVAVGWRGHILRSPNAHSWEQASVPVNVLLTAVDFVDAQNGWVVGHDGTVLRTRDSGNSWQVQSFEVGMPSLLDVMFFSLRRGIAVGTYGAMLQTTDGGENWTVVQNAITDEGAHLNDLVRLADGSVLLVGELGMLAVTRDEGESWVRLESPYESTLFSAAPKGPRGAVIGGLRGKLFVSDDVEAGNWTEIRNPSQQSIFGITERSDGAGHVLAALNGTLQTLSPDGTLVQLELDKASAGIPPVAPAGPPYVFFMTEDVDQELGAFCRALPFAQGFMTVGDSGVRYWKQP